MTSEHHYGAPGWRRRGDNYDELLSTSIPRWCCLCRSLANYVRGVSPSPWNKAMNDDGLPPIVTQCSANHQCLSSFVHSLMRSSGLESAKSSHQTSQWRMREEVCSTNKQFSMCWLGSVAETSFRYMTDSLISTGEMVPDKYPFVRKGLRVMKFNGS
jgi:hypothetical protein